MLKRGLSAGSEVWSSRVQGKVRNLQPKLPLPWILTLMWDENRKAVQAVGCYKPVWGSNGIHNVNVYLLATHRDLWGKGHGQATLDRIWHEVGLGMLKQPLTTKVIMKAEVHRQNERCKRLLNRNGWTYLQDDLDGVHEIWAVAAD